MKVQAKIIFFLLLLFISYAIGIFIYLRFEAIRMNVFISDRTEELTLILDKALETKNSSTDALVRDYTFWDDMVNFVNNPDEDWANENINASLKTFKSNFAYVYKPDFSLVHSIDEANTLDKPFLTKELLEHIFSASRFCHFYIKLPSGIIEINGASIHPTSDPEHKTEPKGYFIVGKILDNEYIRDLSIFASSNIKLRDIHSKQTKLGRDFRKGFINYSKPLFGWDNNPIAVLDATYYSAPLERYNSTTRTFIVFIVIIAALVLISISLFLTYIVTKPLKTISHSIKKEDANITRSLHSKNDEFGNLARLISDYFEQKERQNLLEAELIKAKELLEKEKFKRVIHYMSSGIVICDPDWTIKDINPSARNFFDLPEDFNTPVNILDLIFEKYSASISKEKIITEAGNKTYFKITRPETDIHNSLHIDVTIEFLKNKENSFDSLVVILRDVTDSYKEEVLKRDFLGLISHKLHTPVAVVNQSSVLLQGSTSGMLNNKQKILIDAIVNESYKLVDIFDKLLGFITIETQEAKLTQELIDVKAYLPLLANMILSRYNKSNIDINIDCPDNILVSINKTYFNQILGNLIDNAIKFNDKENTKINITVKPAGNMISFWVKDNGPGIPPEEREKTFEKFYQIEKYFTGNVFGVGLGLSLVKMLVESHGGKISVESELGISSTFQLTLPAASVKTNQQNL